MVDFSKFALPAAPGGLHGPSTVGAQTFPNAFGSLDAWMRFLRDDLGFGCYTWISEPGFSVTAPVEAAAKAGLLVVVRPQPDGGEGVPGMRLDAPNIRRLKEAGASYVQICNEPDNAGEWSRDEGGVKHGAANIDALGHQIMDVLAECIAGGVPALLPPMNAGYDGYDTRTGDVNDHWEDRICLRSFYVWADQAGLLPTLRSAVAAGMLAGAVHNRPVNHPLDYPDDDVCLEDQFYFQNKAGWALAHGNPTRLQADNSCFRSYELIDDLSVQYLGQSIPLFGTEAGYTVSVGSDDRYPKIEDRPDPLEHRPQALQSDLTIQILERFDPSHPKRWRPALVSQHFYHGLYAGDSPIEAWWQNPMLGKDLDAVAAVQQWWRGNASRFADWPDRWTGDAAVPVPLPTPPPASPPVVVSPLPAPGPGTVTSKRKLGRHVIVWNEDLIQAIIATASSPIKLMNNPDPAPVERILVANPATVIVCRRFAEPSEQQEFLDGGIDGGRRWAHAVADQYAQVATVCRKYGVTPLMESVNEPPLSPYDSAPAKLAIFTSGFADEAVALGFVPVTFCLSVGQPEGDEATRQYLWTQLAPALEATRRASGVVGMHPYGRPPKLDGDDNPYYFNRPRYDRDHFWPEQYRSLPLFYGETGLDGGTLDVKPPKDQAGWKAYLKDGNGEPDSAEYARQLAWAADQIDRDSGIIGMTPFTSGATGDWNSFAIDGYPAIEAVYAARKGTTMTEELQVVGAAAGEIHSITTVNIEASGFSGMIAGFADVSFPLLPGSTESRYGGNTLTAIAPFTNGQLPLSINIGDPTTPLPGPVVGELVFRLEWNDGQTVSGGVFPAEGFFPITITPKVASPMNAVDAARLTVFNAAGDGFNADANPIWLTIQEAVNAMKEGKTTFK